MIGFVSGSDACASVEFLTSFDVIGSLCHSCMHNTNNVHPTNNQKEEKITNSKKNNHQA